MPPDSPDVTEILRRHSATVDAGIAEVLRRIPSDAPQHLVEAMTYSLNAGGKRLRPALVLECFAACGGEPTKQHRAVAAAVAIELIHTFSLVHDDLPAMDDDDLRRGKPTNHKVYGEAMAILAGDAMVTLAFETIARDAKPSVVPRLVTELAHAAGPAGMIGGQVRDMAAEGQTLDLAGLEQIHLMKTGALLKCACRLGACSVGAGADRAGDISMYGSFLGLAFQIVDDILDVTSTPEQLGKKTNKDASVGKNTYPQLLGLEDSRAKAQHFVDRAIGALKAFDSKADGLRAIARFVTARTS